jgi:hypothetical protein
MSYIRRYFESVGNTFHEEVNGFNAEPSPEVVSFVKSMLNMMDSIQRFAGEINAYIAYLLSENYRLSCDNAALLEQQMQMRAHIEFLTAELRAVQENGVTPPPYSG